MVKQRPNWLNWRNGVSLGVGLVGLGIAISLATGKLKAGIGGGETVVTSEKTTVGGVEKTVTKTPQEAKTLWDWLSLAGVPLSLAGLGFWLQLQQQKQNDLQKQRELQQTQELAAIEQEQTEKLAAVEREIAEQNRQEEALQNYYDKVSALLVEKNLLAIAAKLAKAERDQDAEEAPTDSATGDTTTPEEKELLDVSVDVIRARTLTTLRRLDSTRKTSLIQFLLESEVISKLKLSLQNADLEGANLRQANLEGTNLRQANLEGAELRYANLKKAFLGDSNLEKATLSGADLKMARLLIASLEEATLFGANLKGVNLDFADLEGADIRNANLSRADLRFANLEGADLGDANLEGADLFGANLKGADIRNANLKGADLGGTNLEGANLKGADLKGAKIRNANLKGADLFDANLERADLGGARGLTKEQLEGEDPPPPILCKTKLPEGIDIDPNRDCE